MKLKFIILGLSLFLLSLSINAQQGWFWQNPLPTGNDLFSVHFIDSQIGWAVGWYGTIIKTTNGGENWFAQNSSTGTYFNSVNFTDNQTGWIVAYGGTILKTTNGGVEWSNIQLNSQYDFYSIYANWS